MKRSLEDLSLLIYSRQSTMKILQVRVKIMAEIMPSFTDKDDGLFFYNYILRDFNNIYCTFICSFNIKYFYEALSVKKTLVFSLNYMLFS